MREIALLERVLESGFLDMGSFREVILARSRGILPRSPR